MFMYILFVVMIDNYLAIIETDKLFNLLKTAGALTIFLEYQ